MSEKLVVTTQMIDAAQDVLMKYVEDRAVIRGAIEAALAAAVGSEMTSQFVDDGWVVWSGQVLPDNVYKIQAMKRDGSILPAIIIDLIWNDHRWEHVGSSEDFIAYRVVQP